MLSMKNEKGKKTYQKEISSQEIRPNSKPTKRVRSKHKKSKTQRSNMEFLAIIISLCAVFVALVISIAMNLLQITIVQVGLPLQTGIYSIRSEEEVFGWEIDSIFADQYHVTFNEREEYTIRNVYSNLVLSSVINYENGGLSFSFLPANDSCQQKFLMSFESEGNRLIPACDIDVESSVFQFGQMVQSAELPTPSEQIISNGVYAFIPKANLQGVLENVSDATLQVVEKDNSPSQLFEISFSDQGYYNIFNLDLETYVDITDVGDLWLSRERELYCGQEWAITEDNGAYQVISSCTGLVWGALDGINMGTSSFVDDVSSMWHIEGRKTVLFAGDSITYGQTNCNYGSSYCRNALSNAVDTEMSIINSERMKYVEISVGNPGATTNSYLYGMTNNYLDKIRQYRIEIAQIMLGTNDSALGVSATAYTRNIAGITDKLFNAGIKTVVINRPIYNAVGQRLLGGYFEGLLSLVNDETVFIGDVQGYDWFRENYWNLDGGGLGFHPNQEGYRVLGELWAAAFLKNVEN